MNLVTSEQISPPKITVGPPLWAVILFWLLSLAVLVMITQLPLGTIIIKYALLGIYGIVLLGVLRNQLKGHVLVTLQANNDGLYFQTNDTNQYCYVPWRNVGLIEKAIFPLNRRGIRIEVTGDLVEEIKSGTEVGNVRTEKGRTFIYTIPQLRNRERLIKQFESFKRAVTQ